MSWEEFCKLNAEEVSQRYQKAHKDLIKIPDDTRGSYKKKIEYLTEKPRSTLLLGKAGRGKTYFMFALMRALFDAGKTTLCNCRFYRSITLDAQLVADFERWKNKIEPIKTLSNLQYLFIDDFGLYRDTYSAERDYYDLIDRRISFERITVMSSNLNEIELYNAFGERIASRLKECTVIEFKGPDLREGVKI